MVLGNMSYQMIFSAIAFTFGLGMAVYTYYKSTQQQNAYAASSSGQRSTTPKRTILDFDDVCCICLNKFDGELEITKCDHIFHKQCLDRHRSYSFNASCPKCRKAL